MKKLCSYAPTLSLLALSLVLGYVALDWRSPNFAGYRGMALTVALVGGLLVLITAVVIHRRARRGGSHRGASGLTMAAAVITLVALGQVIVSEGRFQWVRYTVLNSDPEVLQSLGQHIIVGYRDREEVRSLGLRRAVAGFFITGHNVEGMSASDVRQEVRWLRAAIPGQSARQSWIATDQEGGGVSRLSPPLPRQAPLGEALRERAAESTLESVSRAYGAEQGAGLADLGVNLNLSPVVDVDHQVDNPADRFTRISSRALSDDPAVVAGAAGAYCEGLAASGVQCTLKHFPGIGRVFNDTHVERAVLEESPEVLQASDWLPFRQLANADPSPWIMLSHVTLTAIDPERPVSASTAVVQDLLRQQWGFDGVLITDDLCMRAIHDAPGGVGLASVEALNAGVDMLLISYDPDQYYPVMQSLLQAYRDGRLDRDRLRDSKRRLESARVVEPPRGSTLFPPDRQENIAPSR